MFALFTYAAIALFIDQSSKRAVQKYFSESVSGVRFVQIRQVRHSERIYKRAASRTVLVLIWCLAIVSATWLHRSGLWLQSRFAILGVGCALGGAAGNLSDILRQQHIVDFIDLGWWPVFNLADIAIVCGLMLAFWR